MSKKVKSKAETSPKISVIIPVYNGRRRIQSCLESIFCQSYKNLELIIIDDGSTDDSAKVIQQCLRTQRAFADAKFIHQKNQGVTFARNCGIEAATGSYIAFIDQDDLIAPDYFQSYLAAAQATKADIVVGGYVRTTEDGVQKRKVQLPGANFWEKFIVLAPWAHLYSRKFLVANNIKFLPESIGEDIYFNFLAYSATDKIKIISNADYNWVYNSASVSNDKQNKINPKVDPLKLFNDVFENIPRRAFLETPEVEYFFARYICWYMLFTFRRSQKSDIELMLDKTLSWLKTHYPNYMKNRYLHFRRPKGEPLSIALSVWVFYFLQRRGLLLPFLKFFGQR